MELLTISELATLVSRRAEESGISVGAAINLVASEHPYVTAHAIGVELNLRKQFFRRETIRQMAEDRRLRDAEDHEREMWGDCPPDDEYID